MLRVGDTSPSAFAIAAVGMMPIDGIPRLAGPQQAGHGMHSVGLRHNKIDAAAGRNDFQRPGATGNAEDGIGPRTSVPACRFIRDYEGDEAGVVTRVAEDLTVRRSACDAVARPLLRSEERRVGKECRCRWAWAN